jgi:WD40 repeat protein
MTALYAWDLQHADVAESRKELIRLNGEFEPRLAAAHQNSWVALATTAGDSYVVRLCPIGAHEEAAIIHKQPEAVNVVIVSRDDRRIAVGGGSVSQEADLAGYKATLIDSTTRRSQTLSRSHGDSISALAFSSEGNFLSTGSYDGDAHAWMIPDDWDASRPLAGEPVFLQSRQAPSEELVCPQPGWVASRNAGKAALWDCQPGDPQSLVLSASAADVTAIAATPDGRWIITGHNDGSLRLWPVPRLMMLQRACAMANQQPRPSEAMTDKVTRGDRSFPRAHDALWGNAGNRRPPANHPTAALAG